MQTFAEPYSPAFAGEIRVPAASDRADAAGRAQDHRPPRGAGAAGPTAWSTSASACPRAWPRWPPRSASSTCMTLTAEPGVIGGVPAGGLDFGAAINTQAIIDQPYQFDFYDGGGLDLAFLGLAQADARGQRQRQQVRPAAGRRRRLHQHQPERQEGGLRRHLHRRRLKIASRTGGCDRGGHARKFVREVEHRTFSGREALAARPAGALRHRALRVPAARATAWS